MQSQAKTVEDYLASLPEDRRQAMATVRELILRNLPEGYQEGMQYGMIGYAVPLSRYPKTYNGQALAYAGLASQKNYMSLYLMGIYADPQREEQFREAFRQSGKKLDMGKSCIRFKTVEDLPLDVIARTVAAMSVDQFVDCYERNRPAH